MQPKAYDVIHGKPSAFMRHTERKLWTVGAAAPTIPEPLIEQLARPGRMFIPVGS
jgi:hypothetical protein